jgi:hypothetical protein
MFFSAILATLFSVALPAAKPIRAAAPFPGNRLWVPAEMVSQIQIAGPYRDLQFLNQLSSPSVTQTYSAEHRMRVVVGERSTLRLDDSLELIY